MVRAAVLTLSLLTAAGPGCRKGKKSAPKRAGVQPKVGMKMDAARRVRTAPKPATRPAVNKRRVTTPAPRTARKCWNNGRASVLPLKKLAKASPWGRLTKTQQKGLVARAGFMKRGGELQKIGAQFAVAWPRCPGDGSSCQLFAGLATGKTKLRTVRKVLVDQGWRDSDIEGSALFDVDRDGKPELLVYSIAMGKSQGAVGSTWERSLAILSLPALKLQGRMSLGSGGAASIHRSCKVTLRRADRLCTGVPQIFETASCQEQICESAPNHDACKSGPSMKTQIHAYDKSADLYRGSPWSDVPKNIQPVRDNRPWLVVLASINADRFDAKRYAHGQRAKLERKAVAAKVQYSNVFAKLQKGYWVLVGGRFETHAKAQQHLRTLRKKRVKGYVKMGF